MSKNIILYTDGACSGNPGPGGWAAILFYKDHELVKSGGEIDTTNNRMELTAVIEGLSALKEHCDVTVFSDSKYIIDSVQKEWVYNWRRRGWRTSSGDSALNVDLWQCLLELLELHKVNFIWVKGHEGNEMNERCDSIAVAESKKYSQ